MSAWIVTKTHIDLMVGEAIARRVITPDEADATGRMLWRENLRSVAYRYPRDTDGDRPGPANFRDGDVATYRFTPIELSMTSAELLSLVACYDYQSCEHDDWEQSEAFWFCGKLEATLPPEYRVKERGHLYECFGPAKNAAWGWDDEEVAAALARRRAA